jgi:uncharacterized protein (TIGR02246 family)
MKQTFVVCAAAFAAFVMSGLVVSAANRDADVNAIKENEVRWNQEYAAKDLEKALAHYADDAVLMAPGMPPSMGKEAIRNALQLMLSDPALSLKFQASRVEVAKSGDMAYTQGSYTMTVTDPNSKQVVHDRGSYVTTYRKQADGSWKAVADIATSEVAPSAPPATSMK